MQKRRHRRKATAPPDKMFLFLVIINQQTLPIETCYAYYYNLCSRSWQKESEKAKIRRPALRCSSRHSVYFSEKVL